MSTDRAWLSDADARKYGSDPEEIAYAQAVMACADDALGRWKGHVMQGARPSLSPLFQSIAHAHVREHERTYDPALAALTIRYALDRSTLPELVRLNPPTDTDPLRALAVKVMIADVQRIADHQRAARLCVDTISVARTVSWPIWAMEPVYAQEDGKWEVRVPMGRLRHLMPLPVGFGGPCPIGLARLVALAGGVRPEYWTVRHMVTALGRAAGMSPPAPGFEADCTAEDVCFFINRACPPNVNKMLYNAARGVAGYAATRLGMEDAAYLDFKIGRQSLLAALAIAKFEFFEEEKT